MAEISDLISEMKLNKDADEKRNKSREKDDQAQLTALGDLETTFPAEFSKILKKSGMVGETSPYEHTSLLEEIRVGVDGVKETTFGRMGLLLKGWGSSDRGRRKEAAAEAHATSLMQSDLEDIAGTLTLGQKRQQVEWSNKGFLSKLLGPKQELMQEQLASQQKMKSFAEQTTLNTGEMVKQLSFKEKMKQGLTIFVVAAVVALVAFFEEIGKQIKWMKQFTGDKLGKLFAPIKTFFSKEGVFGKAMTSIKGAITAVKESKFIVGIKTTFTSGWTKLTNFLKPVGEFFKTIVDKGKMLVKAGKDSSKIVKWAGTFGKVLGKVFLPITLLMSAWDAITGALAGWEKEGEKEDANIVTQFVAAIGGGVSKLIKNLVGIPLGWIVSGIGWLAKKMGFDESGTAIMEFGKKIPKFIGDMVMAPFNLINDAIKWVLNFFGIGGDKKKPEPAPIEAKPEKGWLASIIGFLFPQWLQDFAKAPLDTVMTWLGLKKKTEGGEVTTTGFGRAVFGKIGAIHNFAMKIINFLIPQFIKDFVKAPLDTVMTWIGLKKKTEEGEVTTTAFGKAVFGKIGEFGDLFGQIIEKVIPKGLMDFIKSPIKSILGWMGIDLAKPGKPIKPKKSDIAEQKLGDAIYEAMLKDTIMSKFIKEPGEWTGISKETINDMMGLVGLAKGGPFSGSKPIIVGELGPEMIMPSSGGQVMTAQRTQQMLQAGIQRGMGGGGGGGEVAINTGGNVVSAPTTNYVNNGIAARRPIILNTSAYGGAHTTGAA